VPHFSFQKMFSFCIFLIIEFVNFSDSSNVTESKLSEEIHGIDGQIDTTTESPFYKRDSINALFIDVRKYYRT